MLSERSRSQKSMLQMSPFILDVQNRQTYRDRKEISDCLRLRKHRARGAEAWWLNGMKFPFLVMKMF